MCVRVNMRCSYNSFVVSTLETKTPKFQRHCPPSVPSYLHLSRPILFVQMIKIIWNIASHFFVCAFVSSWLHNASFDKHLSNSIGRNETSASGKESLNMQELIIVIVPGMEICATHERHPSHPMREMRVAQWPFNREEHGSGWIYMIFNRIASSFSSSYHLFRLVSHIHAISQSQPRCNHSDFFFLERQYALTWIVAKYPESMPLLYCRPAAFINRTKTQYFKCCCTLEA